MKITKSRLREIIKEEIQDFKEEQNLRKQIREFTSSATGTGGAKQKGYKSTTTNTKQSTYNTKKADATTKSADYKTKNSALTSFAGNKYRKSHRGSYLYSAILQKGYSINPDWTTKANARLTALTADNDAQSAKASALSGLETSQAADLQATVPKEAPPAGKGAGAGFGKGKAAGKGKGKGKGKKGKDDK
tara:strand:+ start:186 stop:755 length:570 start_codon:yes stop_codon:yes gene_type:complete